MRIRCIENNGLRYLTLGRTYLTMNGTDLSRGYVSIIADNGDEMDYLCRRFEAVHEAEVPVPNQKPVDLLEATRKFLGR